MTTINLGDKSWLIDRLQLGEDKQVVLRLWHGDFSEMLVATSYHRGLLDATTAPEDEVAP